jgi:TolB protein
MTRHVFLLSSLLVVGMTLCGCSQTPTASPTATSTATPMVETPAAATAAKVIPTPMPTEEPTLACDIAFDSDRDGNPEIYTMRPDGSHQMNLTNNPGEDFDPVWSPDGTHIAFVSNRVTDAGGGQFIYTMLADGSDVVQVSSHQNESKYPDWSPLGNQIAFSSKGEIFLVDILKGTEVQLTNSPEWDEKPKFSPDGQRIAWIKGEGNNTQLYVMNLDGSNVVQVTSAGTVNDVDWSVDGRIFTHWSQPDGICFNCIVTADGQQVSDAGGKGTIQQFLPFWTADGKRVELNSGDTKGVGNEDIFLVSEDFPDLFLFLTKSPGNDRNPDTAFKCGPTHGVYPQYGSNEVDLPVAQPGQSFVIGYTGSLNAQIQGDLDKACSELGLECVHAENITELADRRVDAIVNSSNRWDVMGSHPQLHGAIERGIPVFVLNAEAGDKGAYNLSAEYEIYTVTLNWMFKQMGGKGEFVYYNFGNSDYIQQILEAVLKDYPGITAIKKAADYNGNSFTQPDIVNMIAKNPNLGAIWSTEQLTDIFWGINDKANSHLPLTECMARKDELISWKNELDAGSAFKCITHIRPGGTAYEGVYVAYYYLSGLKFKPDMLTGEGGNTLKYDIPVITNDSLPTWIGDKLDSLRVGENNILQLPPMTPKEIKAKWFME